MAKQLVNYRLDEDLVEALKRRAAQEHRSATNMLEQILRAALGGESGDAAPAFPPSADRRGEDVRTDFK